MKLMNRVVAAYRQFERGMELLQPLAALLARLYVAKVFFLSGLTKLRDWDTTIMLFTEEYHVPLLPPDVAAVMGTAGEIVLPVLLVLGWPGRFAAAGLFVVNAVAAVSYPALEVLELKDHYLWAVLLGYLVLHGVGSWSLEGWLRCRARTNYKEQNEQARTAVAG
ncbi:DoxX family protein [Chitinilyticum piscinae]|uniref:DoxX family protein n=1 Tax=Chitinilyticum piscinae TaxID=2866724 RepID=A0A8J7K245_9NEIS|nr:DoxX family protein [Chitinilyticum piscinae]MBE9609517.1 DoxX family protein [Chitinilyticum piscinae]